MISCRQRSWNSNCFLECSQSTQLVGKEMSRRSEHIRGARKILDLPTCAQRNAVLVVIPLPFLLAGTRQIHAEDSEQVAASLYCTHLGQQTAILSSIGVLEINSVSASARISHRNQSRKDDSAPQMQAPGCEASRNAFRCVVLDSN
jgi:hypothetical protein